MMNQSITKTHPSQVQNMITMFDADHSGDISFDEYRTLVRVRDNAKIPENRLLGAELHLGSGQGRARLQSSGSSSDGDRRLRGAEEHELRATNRARRAKHWHWQI